MFGRTDDFGFDKHVELVLPVLIVDAPEESAHEGNVTEDTHNETATVGKVESIADKAMKLLNETFRDCGGARAAFAQARDGAGGGLRGVLDAMTQRHKDNLQAQHVEMVLDKAVKSMDWPDRIRFTEGALKRLGPFLPAEIRSEPPERFADHGPEIARAYLKSVSHMQRLLSAM